MNEDGRGDPGGPAEPEGKQRRDGADPDQPDTLPGLARHATAAFLPIALARREEIVRQRELCLTSSRET